MQGVPFAAWILRVLERNGPQDLRSLIWLLESDPEYGHIPLNDETFESKLRIWLIDNSTSQDNGLVRREGYKWSSNGKEVTSQINFPRLQPNQPWLSVGHGDESVYGLFHPRSMQNCRSQGSTNHPIKIGRTKRDVSSRIMELQTGSFQELQLGILIKTDDSIEMETKIHFALRGRRLRIIGQQSEWFLTSLMEIRDICQGELSLYKNQLIS
jgi:hypothetical protein